jgi:glycosyltransferase involved in cell wall biosynthesis
MTAGGGKPLAVAQMIESMNTGGAENLAVQIANALASDGHQAHLYVLFGPGPMSERIDPRVKVRYFHYQRASVRSPGFLPSIYSGYRMLRDAIRADRLDVIQSHLPGANFWGLLLSLRRICAVIPTVHNNREFDYGDADNPLRARLRRMAYHAMLKRCPAMIAVSEQARLSLLQEVGATAAQAQTLYAVPNGVAIPPAISEEDRRSVRAGFGCNDETLLILAAGRHSEQKNFSALLKAAKLLPDGLPNWRLIIAGDGPLCNDLHAQAAALGIERSVDFPGELGNLGQVMQAADVFAMPSLWEGLPLVLLEAMAAGLPIAGTRIDGISEVVTHGQTGLLAEPNDAQSLADALATLLRSKDERERLSEAALALVKETYSLDTVLKTLSKIYDRVS